MRADQADNREGDARAGGHYWPALLVSLSSLLLLLVVPNNIKPWVNEHLPMLRSEVRGGKYGPAFFIIGLMLSGSGLAWVLRLRLRSRPSFASRAAISLSMAIVAGWLWGWAMVALSHGVP